VAQRRHRDHELQSPARHWQLLPRGLEKVGPSHYKLNHFAKSWDTNSNPVGPANIREDVRLSHDGKTFTGTFTIDQYSDSGAPPMHIEGEITGTRITVDSTIDSVL